MTRVCYGMNELIRSVSSERISFSHFVPSKACESTLVGIAIENEIRKTRDKNKFRKLLIIGIRIGPTVVRVVELHHEAIYDIAIAIQMILAYSASRYTIGLT